MNQICTHTCHQKKYKKLRMGDRTTAAFHPCVDGGAEKTHTTKPNQTYLVLRLILIKGTRIQVDQTKDKVAHQENHATPQVENGIARDNQGLTTKHNHHFGSKGSPLQLGDTRLPFIVHHHRPLFVVRRLSLVGTHFLPGIENLVDFGIVGEIRIDQIQKVFGWSWISKQINKQV
jgi:hypothetical protein